MNRKLTLTAALLALVVGLTSASGFAAKGDAKAPAKKPVNKTCPVEGGEVDPEAGTFEYKGKTYGVCCEGCIDEFKKNPKKFEKNLKEDADK